MWKYGVNIITIPYHTIPLYSLYSTHSYYRVDMEWECVLVHVWGFGTKELLTLKSPIQNKGLDTYACLVWCGRSNNTQCDVTVAIVSDSM